MTKYLEDAKIIEHKPLSSDVNILKVYAPLIVKEAKPGQFVNVEVTKQVAPLLRKPLGVADVDATTGILTLIYRILGEGTKVLATLKAGEVININGPLGHGFSLHAKKPLIVGGGCGLAPLIYLAKKLCPKPIDLLMGGRNKEELFWTEFYKDLCGEIFITTDDGSVGTKGNVMALLPELLNNGGYDYVYVCGPEPMMKAVSDACEKCKIPCQVSLEKYMACGIGACLSCTCAGKNNRRLKVCQHGPVFLSTELEEW